MELNFSGLVNIPAKPQPWVVYKVLLIKKGVYLEKKQLVKKFSTRKIYFF